MLDFALYCDIQEELISAKKYEDDAWEYYVKTFMEKNDGDEAVYELIQNCDKKTVERLMAYFEADAPIQQLLKARFSEFNFETNDKTLHEFLTVNKKKSKSFYLYFCEMLDKKGFKNEADFYNHIGMSRQTFSKLRKADAAVSRNHALLMAAGLALNYTEAVDFMRAAGYVFKSQDTRESIISYVMRNKKYTLMELNEILYDFGEKTLTEG